MQETFCAKTLYLGYYKFEYDVSQNGYIGTIPGNEKNRFVMKLTKNKWTLYDYEYNIYAETNSLHNVTICPNDLKWQKYCNCSNHATCNCGNLEYLPMNSPTIHQLDPSHCYDKCYFTAQYGLVLSLTKTEPSVAKYNGENRIVELTDGGGFEISGNFGGNEPTKIAHAASISSICPHDEPVWLMYNGRAEPRSNRGDYAYYPMSHLCRKDDWYNREKRDNQTEEIVKCQNLTVFIGDQRVDMIKTPFINEWTISINRNYTVVEYTMKLIQSRDSDNIPVDDYKWGVVNSEGDVMARTNDFAAQFPNQIKNWFLLCDAFDDCWKGQNVQEAYSWKAAHNELPECQTTSPSYMESTSTELTTTAPTYQSIERQNNERIMFVIIVVVILIGVIVVKFCACKKRGTTEKNIDTHKECIDSDSDTCEEPLIPLVALLHDKYNNSISSLLSISDEAKKTLMDLWLYHDWDKNRSTYELTKPKPIGEGFYGQVYKAEIELCNQINGDKVLTSVAIKKRNKARCCISAGKCHSLVDDLKEASFLAMCEHEYITKLIGITMDDEQHAAIVMPLYHTSLHKYITNNNNRINILQGLKFMWQASSGFEYLLQKNGKLRFHLIINCVKLILSRN